jgi:Baseplate J-like protein
MTLPVTRLDTRSWSELVAEARARLPEYAPDWTDHNLHDPGITLLELFAWLSELLLFRLDRVSPAMLRAFLGQLGVTPAPPRQATAVVALRAGPPRPGPLRLGPGFAVSDQRGAVRFESPVGLMVSPAWLELDPSERGGRGRLRRRAGGQVTDLSAANTQPGEAFAPFGPAPRLGDALELGFEVRPAAAGTELSLYVWTEHWAGDDTERERIRAEWLAARAMAERSGAPCHPPAPWLHHGARTVWEYWAGPRGWQPAESVVDETRALTLSGQVRLRGPADHRPGPWDGRWWIRCRLAAGAAECRPRLLRVAVNATRLRHTTTVTPAAPLGESRGQPWQRHYLEPVPVVPGSVRLALTGPGGETDDRWREVATWDRSGPVDRHYRLDPETGAITFGDGRTGAVPPAGWSIQVRRFRSGGGPGGNVAPGTLTRLHPAPADPITVHQPHPAGGGAGAEPLSRAHGRALDRLAAPQRAITAGDLEELARGVPGVPVGRAHAVPGHHPGHPCLPVPGAVTVVVLPSCGQPPRPTPAFLEAVRRHLDRRRPLATELHVVGPTYVPVSVGATLHVAAGAAADLPAAAQAALAAFFDPLTGGPAGTGWPFGRAVVDSEVLALLGDLPGVDHVDELGLTGPGDAAPRCGNLTLCPTDLVQSAAHTIRVVEEQP